MKDKSILEYNLMGAVTEYAHSQHDKNFNVLVDISCNDGMADASILDYDTIDDYVLSAIKQVCKTDQPLHFGIHNLTAFRIARTAVALALQQKGAEK